VNRRRSLVAVTLGHALEWYDWGVYAIFVPFFATQFFDPHDDVSAVLSSLAVFAVGFVARPVGGFVVGALADRVGRTPMMMLTVGGMAVGSLLIGVSPTYTEIGVGASAILLLARVLQGLSTGGELPTAQTYLAELAPARRRGRWSSVIYIASVGGNTVGVLLGVVLTLALTATQMSAFGWRIPFLLGAVLGLASWWLRRDLHESTAFTAERAAEPAGDVTSSSVRALVRRRVLQVVGLTVGPTVAYYAWVVAMPSYAISSLRIPSASAYLTGVVASLIMMASLPGWGALSDRLGRRPVLLIGAGGSAIAVVGLQSLLGSSWWRLGTVMTVVAVLVGAMVAILPAVYAELFPTRIRTTGLAMPYSVAVALFGGTAPYLQSWLGVRAGPGAFAWYTVALLLVTAVTVATLPETRLAVLDRAGDEAIAEEAR
jgi:MFS transporter, MHS family, alpha-ketoglutarate permease